MSDQPPDTANRPNTAIKLVDLPRGKGLTAAQTVSITRRAFSSVILLAGTAECGKTTLFASLYLLFQRAPFAGYIFAGSDTLVGFEERVFLATVKSGRKKPKTPRTTKSEYLHLRVRREDLSAPARDLVLCDLEGEDFREAKDNLAACRELGIIQRAHRIALLVDGKKLTDDNGKQKAKNDVTALLRNCLETGMLDQDSVIDVLFTKWDEVELSTNRAQAIAFADHIKEQMVTRSQGKVSRVSFTKIAAHPFDGDLPLGYGLADLFAEWIECIWPTAPPPRERMAEPVSLNEFDKYYKRQLPELFTRE
jgi:Double-GTPase 2